MKSSQSSQSSEVAPSLFTYQLEKKETKNSTRGSEKPAMGSQVLEKDKSRRRSQGKTKTGRVFKQLSNVEHVRLRTGMWLGQNSRACYDQHFFIRNAKGGYTLLFAEVEDVPAKLKCLDEVCMNAVDEYNRNSIDKTIKRGQKMNALAVRLHAGGRRVTVEDNGRGIPQRNAEAVFLHLMYGENFDDTARKEHVAGQNGVGVSLVRIVSEYFAVETCHQGKLYSKLFSIHPLLVKAFELCELSTSVCRDLIQSLEERGSLRTAESFKKLTGTEQKRLMTVFRQTGMAGELVPAGSVPLGMTGPNEQGRPFPALKRGTRVTFELAGKYFNDLDMRFSSRLLQQYLLDIAMTNPGLTVRFYDDTVQAPDEREMTFLFKRGLEDILAQSELNYYKLVHEARDEGILLESYILEGEGRTLSWVNGNFASLGGAPIEYFENRICDEVRKKPTLLQTEKRLKVTITRRDVRRHFHVFHILRLVGPRFKSQDKSYVINDLNAFIRQAIEAHLDRMIKKTQLVARIIAECERTTKLKQLADATKEVRRTSRTYVEKLVPCSLKTPPSRRILFLGEGDSAIAGLRSVRDPSCHALFPLRGKPLNVKGLSLGRVLQNTEFKNIVAILGLPVQNSLANLDGLHYHRICIVTDADYDGYAIRSLLLSFFFEYWPELFLLGCVYLVEAPLYEVELLGADKKKRFSYCINDDDFAKIMKKAKEEKATLVRKKRNKGLGETSPAAMEYAIKHNLLPIELKRGNMKTSRDVQNLWFAKDRAAERRREISRYAQLFFSE